MTAAHRNLLAALLLSLITLGSWWVARQAESRIPYRPLPHSPDYYLDRFTAVTTGSDGRPERQLSARRMVHFPDDDSTELTAPRMTFFEPGRPPWQIRAERGWLSGDRQLIRLQGEVNIDREGGKDARPMHVTTRDLRIHPEQEFAETTAEVYARSDRNWIRATGLQAWFTGPVRIKLLSNVRGRYEVE